jgi:hypothetical protein
MSRRPELTGFLLSGLVVTLLLAGLVSGYASDRPDGLEAVAEEQGFADTARDSPLASSPLADYGLAPVEDERLSTGLAGVLGVGLTLGLGAAVFVPLRRRARRADPERVAPPAL